MWRHLHHRLVVGYHGCDRQIAERVLLGREHLKKSTNVWDWLGTGIYFWEHSRQRAFEFAEWKRTRGEVDDPCVLGAYLDLGDCFDLTDRAATALLGRFHQDYLDVCRDTGVTQRENRRAGAGDHDLLLRDLDCAVLNLGLANLDRTAGGERYFYQTVRGVFVEGEPAYPGAAIRVRTHIQIAVRDPSCILGYFMPSSYDEEEEVR